MGRRALTVSLLVVPAVGLGALGLMVVASAPARAGAAGIGAAGHFAVRQAIGLCTGAIFGAAIARVGARRALAAAPAVFLVAFAVALAVFVPGIGVRAAGARRWLHVGPLSGSAAPFLVGAVALIVSAARAPRTRTLAVAAALGAVLVLVAEPDFSAAAIALLVAFAALAGGGVNGRRLWPVAALLLAALSLGALRFGYVDNRIRGYLSPESDRRGKGFEVLALARANAAGAAHPVGLGHGSARHRLSSPASDYAYAVVKEELGRPGALGVVAAWLAIAAGIVRTVRSSPGRGSDRTRRAAAVGCGTALLAPAALHLAVCRGFLPIIGVTMPFLSYDPALTVASSAELGLLAALVLGDRAPGEDPEPGASA